MTEPVNVFEVEFNLSISANDYLKYYRGQVKWVLAKATNGQKVKFLAHHLTRYVSHQGVHGVFVLRYTGDGKVISLLRKSQN